VQYKFAPIDTITAGAYYFGFCVTFIDGSVLIWPYLKEMFPIEVTP
jgi:hypothetical protein